jgi:hypothetical protein
VALAGDPGGGVPLRQQLTLHMRAAYERVSWLHRASQLGCWLAAQRQTTPSKQLADVLLGCMHSLFLYCACQCTQALVVLQGVLPKHQQLYHPN